MRWRGGRPRFERLTPHALLPSAPSSPLNQLFGDFWPSYRQRFNAVWDAGRHVDTRATIVNNQHFIAGAESIRVSLADGQIADATNCRA